ncbi:MAG TPA: DUF177 domain-containing protein [Terriglobales bacterium]|jgi:uncharacterized protein|nr:DUF177 domain-containing protein [Terriglobales bacterium]
MFISLRELHLHEDEQEFHEEWQSGTIDLGPDAKQSSPLKTDGKASIVEENHGRKSLIEDIRLVGEFSTRLELLCARCLDPVYQEVRKTFDLMYRPQGVDAGKEEISLGKDDVDIGYYQGEGLLLEEVLREQLLLALPLKLLCSEDCKGLCRSCGQNLNQGACGCTRTEPDPRWHALGELRDKLGH